MKKLLTLVFVLFAGAVLADPPLSKIVDFSASTAPALQVYQANARSIIWTYRNNSAVVNGTNSDPYMCIFSSNTSPYVVPATCTWISQTQGTMLATFQPADLNTNGSWQYEVGTSTNGVPTTARQGSFSIVADPLAAGASAITLQTVVDWSRVTSINATNGPWLAGSNVTLRATGIKGRVYIDSAAGGTAGALVAASNLSDLVSVSTARSSLGLGSAATSSVTQFATAAQGLLAQSALQVETDAAALGALTIHTNRTDNPHHVTAGQIGALTAEADPIASGAINNHTNLQGTAVHGLGSASTNNTADFATAAQGLLAQSALQVETDAAALGALTIHTNRTDNPHHVTAGQIGALTAEADPIASGAINNHTNLQGTAVHGLGSASTNNTADFATAAQGSKADTALQNAGAFVSILGGQYILGPDASGYTSEWKFASYYGPNIWLDPAGVHIDDGHGGNGIEMNTTTGLTIHGAGPSMIMNDTTIVFDRTITADISGNAGTANHATTADTSTNALQLGGIPAASYLTNVPADTVTLQAVLDRGNNATNGMTVMGNVGIGTNNPSTKLDVNGAATIRGALASTSLTVNASSLSNIWLNGHVMMGENASYDTELPYHTFFCGSNYSAYAGNFKGYSDAGMEWYMQNLSTGPLAYTEFNFYNAVDSTGDVAHARYFGLGLNGNAYTNNTQIGNSNDAYISLANLGNFLIGNQSSTNLINFWIGGQQPYTNPVMRLQNGLAWTTNLTVQGPLNVTGAVSATSYNSFVATNNGSPTFTLLTASNLVVQTGVISQNQNSASMTNLFLADILGSNISGSKLTVTNLNVIMCVTQLYGGVTYSNIFNAGTMMSNLNVMGQLLCKSNTLVTTNISMNGSLTATGNVTVTGTFTLTGLGTVTNWTINKNLTQGAGGTYTNYNNAAGATSWVMHTLAASNFVGNGSGLTNLSKFAFPICVVNASTTMVTAAGVELKMPMTNTLFDTHLGYNSNTFEYTLPSAFPGYYDISAIGSFTNATDTYGWIKLYEVTPVNVTNEIGFGKIVPGIQYQSAVICGSTVYYTGGVHKIYMTGRTGQNDAFYAQPPGKYTGYKIQYSRGL